MPYFGKEIAFNGNLTKLAFQVVGKSEKYIVKVGRLGEVLHGKK